MPKDQSATGSNQRPQTSPERDLEGGGQFGAPLLLHACGVYEARDRSGRWYKCCLKEATGDDNYVASVQLTGAYRGVTRSRIKVNINDLRLRIVYGVPNLYEGKDLGGQWYIFFF